MDWLGDWSGEIIGGLRWKKRYGALPSCTAGLRQHATSVNLGLAVPLLLSPPWAPCPVRAVVLTLSPFCSLINQPLFFFFYFWSLFRLHIFFFLVIYFVAAQRKVLSLPLFHVQRASLYLFPIKLSPTMGIVSIAYIYFFGHCLDRSPSWKIRPFAN